MRAETDRFLYSTEPLSQRQIESGNVGNIGNMDGWARGVAASSSWIGSELLLCTSKT